MFEGIAVVDLYKNELNCAVKFSELEIMIEDFVS
jgi:hypothetical protein